MSLPIINLNITTSLSGLPDSGDLLYKYAPLKNLNSVSGLTDLTISESKSGIDITSPIEVNTEYSYDGSVNIVINDKLNPPKLVNSRFYLTDSDSYKIADRNTSSDSNIYTEDNFISETNLIKNVHKVVKLDFLGIESGGIMPVGNYTFYFKLADADGNLSDFVSESGKVICHIGKVNDPSSIRGGLAEESSEKLIKFKLRNLDVAYSYIVVYYSKSSDNGEDVETNRSFYIDSKYKITGEETEVIISGYENHVEIDPSELNIRYSYFDSVKTQANCQNMTFFGNISNDYELFKELEDLSLRITPELTFDKNIGFLDGEYNELFNEEEGNEYYNVKNIYYKLGYWNEEIYRFGIVYILNDYSLSPVFNIRGIAELTLEEVDGLNIRPEFHNFGTDYINNVEDSLIYKSGDPKTWENSKGVFKINTTHPSANSLDSRTFKNEIKPIGIRFNFEEWILKPTAGRQNLKNLTKGFFIVRQKRIPTILAQGLGIATSAKAYLPLIKSNVFGESLYVAESFLTSKNGKPKLENNLFGISDNPNLINKNAIICPEATIRSTLFNNFFNSSDFKIKRLRFNPASESIFYKNESVPNSDLFYLNNQLNLLADESITNYSTKLTLIEPGVSLISDGTYKYSTKAGDETTAWKHSDPINGDVEDLEITGITDSVWSNSTSKIRGNLGAFVGVSSGGILHGNYYNVLQKDYDFENNWKNYFLIRYNDSSPYHAISDRIEYPTTVVGDFVTEAQYRGDCYIVTYTQRMITNFIDPEMPTNKKIVDPWTWYKNYKVVTKASTSVNVDGSLDESLEYKKIIPSFTFKGKFVEKFKDESSTDWEPSDFSIIEPTGKKFTKYSDINGLFGTDKINRVDVNTVHLGYWVTFKICSSTNLSLRDLTFSNISEESIHNQKRSFYPNKFADKTSHLLESSTLNKGISKSLSDKYYFELPRVPFIKTSFTNRIHYSNVLIDTTFQNGSRIFESKNYQDYTMEYGALVKLIEWYGTLVAVMEHGILLIPVNERAMMANASGESVYINTENVLPKNPKVLSNSYGSLWADSVIKTSQYIYGIDTVAKKIWRTNGQKFEIISDLKIQKFLNDNIKLRESDKANVIDSSFIKTHYNSFKLDVMFVLKYEDVEWNLCWNELLEKWVTRYTWFPEFSENINNIFYTFANQSSHQDAGNRLFKHGFAGTEELLGEINPTQWYDEQHPFEFEFIVVGVQGIQKIFDNLKIISNSSEPDSFFYEVVGEGFDWNKDKSKIYGFTDSGQFNTYLNDYSNTTKKLPYILSQSFMPSSDDYFYRDRTLPDPFNMSDTRDITLRKHRKHNKTKEIFTNIYQKGLDIKKFGRMKGNMQYLEDSWDIQIQPISFKYAYLKNGELAFSDLNGMKLRDKYIKIRIKYDGKQYAIISAIKTLFTISYA